MLDEDDDRARTTARGYAQLYLGLSNYADNLLRHGFDEADVAGSGSDRLIDAVIPHGTDCECRGRRASTLRRRRRPRCRPGARRAGHPPETPPWLARGLRAIFTEQPRRGRRSSSALAVAVVQGTIFARPIAGRARTLASSAGRVSAGSWSSTAATTSLDGRGLHAAHAGTKLIRSARGPVGALRW